jgi:hypothetical protein
VPAKLVEEAKLLVGLAPVGHDDPRRQGEGHVALARRDAQLATAVRHDEPVSPPPVKVELRVATTADDPSALAPTPTPAPSLPFTALESLDDAGWQRLLLEAESEVVLLAFVGAEPKLIERILRGFSPAQRAHWRRQFAHPGPVRLRDIDAAQQRLTALAAELVEAGELHFGPRPRLAAA